MKKYIYILCLFTFISVNAQDDTTSDETTTDKLTFAKGSNLLNAGLFFNSSKIENNVGAEQKQFLFGANTAYGYAINDNFFLGLGLGYVNRDAEFTDTLGSTQDLTSYSFNIFPYVRYYKGLGKHLAIFGQGEVLFSNEKEELNGIDTQKINTFFVGIRPGLTYMLNKNFALEITVGALGYTSRNIDDLSVANSVDTDTSEFGLSLNFDDLIFGLSYYF
ncbi:MAG: outer membrane beta-barrel protein [Bacteroidota bacterium]